MKKINKTIICRCLAVVAVIIGFFIMNCTETAFAATQYIKWNATLQKKEFKKNANGPIPSAHDWPLDVTDTNVTLIRARMGLNRAEVYYDSAETEKQFDVQPFGPRENTPGEFNIPGVGLADSQRDDSCESIRYKKAIAASDDVQTIPGVVRLVFRKAARHLNGTLYDVELALSSMRVKANQPREQGIPIAYGCWSSIRFAAFPYENDHWKYGQTADDKNKHGYKVTVSVRLYKAGTYKFNNTTRKPSGTRIGEKNKLIWGFEDIDVGDLVKDGKRSPRYIEMDGDKKITNAWAEHVEMSNPFPYDKNNEDTDALVRFYPTFYVPKETELSIEQTEYSTTKKVVLYHNKKSVSDDGATDVIYAVNPYYFSYIWQGSACSTNAVAITGTRYTGKSYVYKGETVSSSNAVKNAAKVTVNDSTQKILFYHEITRDDDLETTDDEEYYIETQTDYPTPLATRGGKKCTEEAHCKYISESGKTEKVYDTNKPTGNPITVSLEPGQTQNIWQRLMFQPSNTSSRLYGYAKTRKEVPCTKNIMGSDATTAKLAHTACVSVYRPPARFTADIAAKVSANNDDSYTNFSDETDPKGTKITSADGKFKIRFSGNIRRVESATNEAGGAVATEYSHVIKYNNYNNSGTPISSTRYPDNGTKTTSNLVNSDKSGKSSEAIFSNHDVYSGQLRYGEHITICGTINYDDTVDTVEGNHSTETGTCVTVYRDPKYCVFDDSKINGYGYLQGENLGRIGAANHTINPGDSNYLYTPYNPTNYMSAANHTLETTIYARPGDNVRFMYQICAGGAYTVNNNDTLNEAEHRTTYTATGSLSNSSSRGYLFGETVPTRDTSYTSGLRYNNSRSWSSNGDNFLNGESTEKILASPSHADADPTTYDVNTYNTQSYSCDNYNSDLPAALDAHYQIAGSVVTDDIDSKCHAYTKTGVSSDVGHTITQQLNWNHLKIDEGTSSPEVKDNTSFTARANVKIPYNYIIEPTISAKTEGNKHVVYLDESVTFNSDLYVTPRVNTIFGEESANNKYATITKKTQIRFNWYIKRGLSTIRSGTIRNESGVILNNTGLLQGTATAPGATTEGGHRYANYTIHIDDNLAVGDKVCADISITPADSHNNYNVASVYGEKVSNLSTATPGLSENGTTTKTRTACYTVAKKPTMSVEGANAYAGGEKGFVTSRYSRNFATSTNSNNTNYLFGSWSEYGVYGKVKLASNLGMASGATFGYATKNNGTTLNATRSNVTSYTNGGQVAIRDDEARRHVCTFSTQTFINDKCDEVGISQLGMQGIGREQAEEFRKRIYDRFISLSNENAVPESSYTNTSVCPTNWQWKSSLTTDDKCMKMPDKNGVKKTYASIRGWMNRLKFDENGINRTHIQGNAYLGAGDTFLTVWGNHNFKNSQIYVDPETGIEYPDRNFTRIIEVDDTLVLDADIKVGSYKKNSWGEEITDDDPTLENAGEVVQFILIAKNIKITSRVNRIDAILIADNIDTCAYDVPKSGITSTNNGVRNGRELSIGNISANTCNNAIHFRAPVIAKKIELKRTFGADNGTASIRRAEIFDLNPYTYLWSYGQMSRYSQAVTTYSRELAPRY